MTFDFKVKVRFLTGGHDYMLESTKSNSQSFVFLIAVSGKLHLES
jgi:hypothetical protein